MKRGRKLGSLNPGSTNSLLLDFAIGERRYIETTAQNYGTVMRAISSSALRGAAKDGKWEMKLFTAVSASKHTDIRYLVCVERVL